MRKKFWVSALALVLILVFSVTALSACNKNKANDDQPTESEKVIAAATQEETELKFAFATDVHVMAEAEIADVTNADFVAREARFQKMNYISEAIFHSFVDEILASGVNVLLVSGDLAETSSVAAHTVITTEFNRLEQNGVNVWVVPGNHDVTQNVGGCYCYSSEGTTPIDSITAATKMRFAQIYENFGYSGTNRLDNTLCYSVDLNSKYTLVALDNNAEDFLSDDNSETLSWAVTQVENAVKAGKTPLLMLHQPLVEVFSGLYDTLGLSISGAFTKNCTAFAKSLYTAGLRYVFTGHVHSNNLTKASYDIDGDTSNGKEAELVQITGPTLTAYGGGYRVVRFTENYVDTEYHALNAPAEKYLPSYLSASEKTQILSNWQSFSLDYSKTDVKNMLNLYTAYIPEYLSSYALGISYGALSTELKAKVDTLVTGVKSVLTMPIRSTDGSTSLESVLKEYGLADGVLPQSKYTSLADLVAEVAVTSFGAGLSAYGADSAEVVTVKYAVFTVFALLQKYDLFGLMKSAGLDVTNSNATSATITNLVTTGTINLLDADVLHDLLKLSVLSGVENQFVAGLLSTPAADLLDMLANGAFQLLAGGFKIDFAAYFGVDATATANDEEGAIHLNGDFYFGKLFDEVVAGKLIGGAICNSYAGTNYVIVRNGFDAYTK